MMQGLLNRKVVVFGLAFLPGLLFANVNNATALQPGNSSPVVESSASPSPNLAPASNTMPVATKNAADLTQIEQAETAFSAATNEKLASIQVQNNQLQSRVTRLTQALTIMNEQLSAIHMSQLATNKRLIENDSQGAWVNKLTESWQGLLGGVGFKLFSGFFAILLIVLAWRFRPKAKQKTAEAVQTSNEAPADLPEVKTDSADIEEQNEYDFINSHEAVPAKLDLARAYIAMGDHASAEKTLQEVLDKGNEKQRGAAQRMIKEIAIGSPEE